MDVFSLLMASKDGVVALTSVTLAVTMLVGTLGALVHKSKQR